MKKISKFIYFMLAFALITCMAIFNPAVSIFEADAEATLPENTISISTGKINSTVENGQDMKIPMPTVKNAQSGAKTFVEVKDRSGKVYNYEVGAAYTETYFETFASNGTSTTEPNEVAYIRPAKLGKGTYTVKYKVVQGAKTYYSNEYKIEVKGVVYNWEFDAENTKKNIIPSVTESGARFELPLPKIVDSNKEEVAVYTDATNIEITKDGEALTVNEDAEFKFEDGKVIFTPTLASGASVTNYVVKYKSTVTALADRKFEVKVESGYSNKAELEVTHNSITNAQIANKTVFPTANVTDKTHNKSKIDVNTYITIKKSSETVAELQSNQYEYEFTETGEYTVYYKVVDAYGNEATSKGYSVQVSDRSPYIIDYAKDYDTSEEGWEDKVVTGVSYLIPSQAGFSGFYLPAIYAKDYKDAYEDLEFTRVLEEVKSDGTGKVYNIDKAADNGALDEDNTDYSKAIKFEFPDEDASVHAGKVYRVKYSVKDKTGLRTEVFATIYTIKITNVDAEAYNVDKGLTISFPTISETIDPQASFSFTSASAKEKPVDDNLTADERVEVRNYYYYGDKETLKTVLDAYKATFKAENADYNEKYGYKFDDFYTALAAEVGKTDGLNSKIYELNAKNGKVEFELEDYTGADTQKVLTIFAVAINDQGQFVYKAQEVKVNNTTETNAPVIEEVEETYDAQLNGYTSFNQGVTVTLPSITFSDDEDDSLRVVANCYVDTPDKTVDVIIENFRKNGIELAKIDTTYAGTYYVTYTATDDAGNVVTYVSTFEVAKTAKAHIEVENGSSISKKVGEEVSFVVNLVGDGEYDDIEYSIVWADKQPTGLGANENSYRFDRAGTYVATISAKYTMNGVEYNAEPSVTVTVSVTEPTISWNSEYTTGDNNIFKDETADIGETIRLYASNDVAKEEGKNVDTVDVKVTFTGKLDGKDEKDKVVELTLVEDGDCYYTFDAEGDGTYKVTYTATTKYNSTTKSFNIVSGDHYDPIITIASNKLNDSSITYNGEDIAFKVASFKQATDENNNKIAGKYIMKITASEGEKKIFDYDITVNFEDKDKDRQVNPLTTDDYSFSLTGDKVSSEGSNNWTITGVGTYELKITVKDTNGNSVSKSISFKVASKTEPKKSNDNVAGIVLIIVSAVIMAGIILFFAFAGKRNKSTKRIKSVKSEDNTDNK